MPVCTTARAFCFLTVVLVGQTLPGQTDDVPRTLGNIEVRDPSFEQLIDPEAAIEVVAHGFQWSEGPVWLPSKSMLLFSDVPRNRIHRWKPGEETAVYLEPSGFDGPQASGEREPGSNGLAIDARGRLVVCDHGNRRVYRLEADGTRTTLADRFRGQRFNSPNDLVIHPNGDIYFTDPPYGLRAPSKRELDFCGVYRLRLAGDGTDSQRNEVELLDRSFERPNGIGLSPDHRTLYVAQSHRPAPIYQQFPVQDNGSLGEGKLLFDASDLAATDPGMPDGMTIDAAGNLWATGPGGVLVIHPSGKLLGRIVTGQPTANCCFGEDGSVLLVTSGKYLLRVPTRTRGLAWKPSGDRPAGNP